MAENETSEGQLAGSADPDTNLDLPDGMFRSSEKTGTTTITIDSRKFGPKNHEITFSEVDGQLLLEGDILLGSVEEFEKAKSIAGDKGIVITGENFRWPDGIVPFVTVPGLVNRVQAAIDHWEARTPIRFVPRDPNQHGDWISFEQLNGCFSHVGRQGGKQVISLGTGCGLGAAIHEIGHALGLWHEQSREDRDKFVEVRFENIIPEHRHNFNKHVVDGDDIGFYDHGSIMHYPPGAFSSNGKDTIVAKNGAAIGQRNGLSKGDIATIRAIYPDLDWDSVASDI